jgi:hypothetical protein
MTPSNIVGTVLMAVGGCLLIVWALGDLGLFDTKSGAVTYIIVSIAALGLGVMLRAGEGHRISDAFMWWFKRGKPNE